MLYPLAFTCFFIPTITFQLDPKCHILRFLEAVYAMRLKIHSSGEAAPVKNSYSEHIIIKTVKCQNTRAPAIAKNKL
jgi:hypothetical protein